MRALRAGGTSRAGFANRPFDVEHEIPARSVPVIEIAVILIHVTVAFLADVQRRCSVTAQKIDRVADALIARAIP